MPFLVLQLSFTRSHFTMILFTHVVYVLKTQWQVVKCVDFVHKNNVMGQFHFY